jgi:hypothetical protein
MTDQRVLAFAQQWLTLRARLEAEFPDLDTETLQDTLEGETGAIGLVEKLTAEAIEAEALADGLDGYLKAISDRRTRLQERSQRFRDTITALLTALEYKGPLRLPIATLSLTRRPPGVAISDESKIPDHLCKIITTRRPDKVKIEAAMKTAPVEGAHMTNGSTSLSIRIK